VVIPVPLPHIIQGDQEQVSAEQLLQDGVTVTATGYCIAKVIIQFIQDCGLEQEYPNLLRLLIQNLLGEVCEDMPVIAAQVGNECR